MLKKLARYNGFGRKKEIQFLFSKVLSESFIEIKNIKQHFSSQSNYNYVSVEALIALVSELDVVDISESAIKLNSMGMLIKEDIKKYNSTEAFLSILVDRYISEVLTFIPLKFDSVEESYYILNSDIPLDYSGIRNLLINLGFIMYGNNNNVLVINKEYISKVEKYFRREKKLLSLEKFKQFQALKEELGKQGEEYVLKYEIDRLTTLGFNNTEKVKMISDIDVNAGYDIISYENNESTMYDRFIEVKSFDRQVSFYWSENEVAVAKEKKENYYLFLVDRSQINKKGYSPLIIVNPYQSVFNNQESWLKEAKSWKFSQI